MNYFVFTLSFVNICSFYFSLAFILHIFNFGWLPLFSKIFIKSREIFIFSVWFFFFFSSFHWIVQCVDCGYGFHSTNIVMIHATHNYIRQHPQHFGITFWIFKSVSRIKFAISHCTHEPRSQILGHINIRITFVE